MKRNSLPIGTRVETVMGIKRKGVVCIYSGQPYTDGQYRDPHSSENVVFVNWDDGTYGWTHKQILLKF